MVCAIIDIGSNTMRMSVYKVEQEQFHVLLSKKETAGLVGYISDGVMSEEGIIEMKDVLQQFISSLEYVDVDFIHVFATASLRNIKNTVQVIERIYDETGLEIELISGEEEAMLSFKGAIDTSSFEKGCLFDLGGGSTEIVVFDNQQPHYINSLDIGCLNLFKRYVEKIMPKKREVKAIKKYIEETLSDLDLPCPPDSLLIGVGGTARSLKKLMNYCKKKDDSCKEITIQELDEMVEFLLNEDALSRDVILKKCPDRIHTIIPGALVIQALAKKVGAKRLYISDYGVREGYLWKKVIKSTI